MILEGAATYHGLSDIIEVMVWIEEEDGTDLYQRVVDSSVTLMHADTDMLSIGFDSSHYAKEINDEKGQFRIFFHHPPIQHHQYVLIAVTLDDAREAEFKTNVLTEKMLQRENQLTNPVFGGRPTVVYELPIEKEQR